MVGADTFSPLAPVLSHERKVAMSPSFNVHGGQIDTKYTWHVTFVDGTSGIRRGENFRRLS